MSGYPENAGKPAQATPSTAWSYVSGKVSVLETMLLGRSFFENLVKCKTLSDARSMMAKTPYRQYFSTDESILHYSSSLDTAFDEIMGAIYKDSPQHIMRTYFEASGKYIDFRKFFIRLCQRGASASELENAFDMLASEGGERVALAHHVALLKSREAPQNADPVARSLYLDSIVCTLKLQIASDTPEESVKTILRDMAVLECWTALLRSRWNGTSADIIQKWFIVPDAYVEFVKSTASLAESNPALALNNIVSGESIEGLRSAGLESLRQNIDALVREAVRNTVLAIRMAPFGPGKVLAFYVAMRIESENLRLALSSVVSGIESRIVVERFRREYA